MIRRYSLLPAAIAVLLHLVAPDGWAQAGVTLKRTQGTGILVKVVARREGMAAQPRNPGDTAFQMALLQPFLIRGEDSSSYWITADQTGRGASGWVAKSDVYLWNTREGLHLNPKTLMLPASERPRLQAWQSRTDIESFLRSGDPRFGAAYREPDSTPLPPKLAPHPVTESAVVKASDLERRIFHVLLGVNTRGGMAVGATREGLEKVMGSVTFCVVFDATESMKKYAVSMANTIRNLLDGLADNGNAAAGLVLFRDIGDWERYKIIPPQSLRAMSETLAKESDHMAGGGDPAEPVLDAVLLGVRNFPWTGGSGSRGAKRVMILVANTDAKPMVIGLEPRLPKGSGIPQVAKEVKDAGITIFSLQAGDLDLGRLKATLRGLADTTGGEFYPYTNDQTQYNLTFASHIRRFIEGTMRVSKTEGKELANSSQMTGNGLTIGFEVLKPDQLRRLREAGLVKGGVAGGLSIQDAWMVEQRDLYEEKVLIDKDTFLGLLRFLDSVSGPVADIETFRAAIRQNLRAFLGEEIQADVEFQEIFEKKLGIHFPTALLSLSIEQLEGMNPRERANYQKRIVLARENLGRFMESSAAALNREGQLWVPVRMLP
jgi:hypothetical protein